MKRIIINSDINAETTALMCAHLQNVQTHSVLLTDSFVLLRYGEKFDLENTSESLTDFYVKKLDDVLIICLPDLLKVNAAEEITNILDEIERLVTEQTLETIEASTVYLGSTVISEELIREHALQTESTLVQLNQYKVYQVFNDQFTWSDNQNDESKDKDIIAYTCIFNKKHQKKAAELKRPVLCISQKDLYAVTETQRLNNWTITGLMKSLAVEIMIKHTGVNKECIEGWLPQIKK